MKTMQVNSALSIFTQASAFRYLLNQPMADVLLSYMAEMYAVVLQESCPTSRFYSAHVS